VLLYLVFATSWNLVTPPFETPDEDAHARYVLFLASEGRIVDPRVDGERAGNESFHPPLYYATAAAVLRLSGASLTPPLPQPVPGWDWDTMPKNYFVPVPDAGWLRGLRELSVLFGAITVVCTWVAATVLGAGGAIRTAATLSTAALPQFTYLMAAVNPDALAVALASVGLVLLLRILHAPPASARDVAVFGVVTGVAVLAEYHAIYLLVLAALSYPMTRGGWRALIRAAAIAGAGFAAAAGWWFVLNLVRYGEPSGLSMQRFLAPELIAPRSLLDPYFVYFFPAITYDSFFGAFGWLNAYLPGWLYAAYGALWIAAVVGIGRALLVRRSWDTARRALVLAPIILLILVIYANLTFNAPQGRYFFPALVAISMLWILGLAELRRPMERLAVVAPAFLVFANLYSLAYVAIAFAH
jgi:hypothetical protein